MEHSVHLDPENFVKGVAPATGHAILKKVQRAFRDAQEGDTEDIDINSFI